MGKLACLKCVIVCLCCDHSVVVTTTTAGRRMSEVSREIDNMQNVAFGRVACRYSPHTSSGIGLGIVRIFSSAFYPRSAFSHPRFILDPPFLIRVLSSIRLFSSAFYPPSAFSHPYFLIRIRIRHPYPHPYPRFIPTLYKLPVL